MAWKISEDSEKESTNYWQGQLNARLKTSAMTSRFMIPARVDSGTNERFIVSGRLDNLYPYFRCWSPLEDQHTIPSNQDGILRSWRNRSMTTQGARSSFTQAFLSVWTRKTIMTPMNAPAHVPCWFQPIWHMRFWCRKTWTTALSSNQRETGDQINAREGTPAAVQAVFEQICRKRRSCSKIRQPHRPSCGSTIGPLLPRVRSLLWMSDRNALHAFRQGNGRVRWFRLDDWGLQRFYTRPALDWLDLVRIGSFTQYDLQLDYWVFV